MVFDLVQILKLFIRFWYTLYENRKIGTDILFDENLRFSPNSIP